MFKRMTRARRRTIQSVLALISGAFLSATVPASVFGSVGEVLSLQKISHTEGGFTGTTMNLGSSVASLGDLDGDGVGDLAVGAERDNDGGTQHGAIYILFLNTDGTVKSHQKISDTEGGFMGTLGLGDRWGNSVAFLRDLDADTVGDIVVDGRLQHNQKQEGVSEAFGMNWPPPAGGA